MTHFTSSSCGTALILVKNFIKTKQNKTKQNKTKQNKTKQKKHQKKSSEIPSEGFCTVSEQHLKAAAAAAALHQALTAPPLPSLLPPPGSPCSVSGPAHTAQRGVVPLEVLPSRAAARVALCTVRSVASASACISVNRRSEHGGVSQREHQPAGLSLSQAPAGRDRRASARIPGGHFHHAEIRPGRRPPQLPLGLRESRGHPQRIDRGAGGHLLSIKSVGIRF